MIDALNWGLSMIALSVNYSTWVIVNELTIKNPSSVYSGHMITDEAIEWRLYACPCWNGGSTQQEDLKFTMRNSFGLVTPILICAHLQCRYRNSRRRMHVSRVCIQNRTVYTRGFVNCKILLIQWRGVFTMRNQSVVRICLMMSTRAQWLDIWAWWGDKGCRGKGESSQTEILWCSKWCSDSSSQVTPGAR